MSSKLMLSVIQKRPKDAQKEAEVAHAVHDEGLHRRRDIGRGFAVVETDQQVRGDAHALPAEEQLNRRLSAVTSISIAKVKKER